MSMTYWVISGVGINTDAIWNRLDDKKVVQFLAQKLSDEVTATEAEAALAAIARGESCPINIRDYLYGEPMDNLGEALQLCDDTETLIYGDDGAGTAFFYYPPSMPWQRGKFDPTSIDEVHQRIIDAVQKLTDMTREEVEDIIDDDLNVVGCN